MAWVKVPPEHHPIFMAAVPKDPRVTTLQMFGGIAARVNGNMFGGLFGRSAIAKLSPEDRQAALALDGAAPFDPMGNGRASQDMVMLPEDVMDDPAELRSWLGRALAFVATRPPKLAKPPRKSAMPGGERPPSKTTREPASPKAAGAAARPSLATRLASGAKSKPAARSTLAATPKPATTSKPVARQKSTRRREIPRG
jgi:TfoX/Sxy family transcriptional regulator of competence genes